MDIRLLVVSLSTTRANWSWMYWR